MLVCKLERKVTSGKFPEFVKLNNCSRVDRTNLPRRFLNKQWGSRWGSPEDREFHPLLFPCAGSITSPANHITLKMPHVFLSYLNTLSVGPAEV